MNGILIVDKEKGMTSHDVIYKIKRGLKLKKVGHAGTLDPLATGVLVVLVNGATKLSNYLLNNDKEYLCEIVIGKATDTEDVSGNIILEKKVDKIKNVDEVLKSLIGKQEQTPPMYSSIRHQGRKLYEIAREGVEVERKARMINIFDLKRTSEIEYTNGEAKFNFKTHVSKGTYIRSLCVEIGKRLGFPAYMLNLRRISSGKLKIENAYMLSDVLDGKAKLINMLEVLNEFKIIDVNEDQARDISNGNKLKLPSEEAEVVLAKDNQLLAIYERNKGLYRAKRVWK